jgi:hypothetical protein
MEWRVFSRTKESEERGDWKLRICRQEAVFIQPYHNPIVCWLSRLERVSSPDISHHLKYPHLRGISRYSEIRPIIEVDRTTYVQNLDQELKFGKEKSRSDALGHR